MSLLKQRAQKLRIRIATLRIKRGITMRSLSSDIGFSYEYTNAVLRGKYESEAVCEKMEERLDKLEADNYQLATAA